MGISEYGLFEFVWPGSAGGLHSLIDVWVDVRLVADEIFSELVVEILFGEWCCLWIIDTVVNHSKVPIQYVPYQYNAA